VPRDIVSVTDCGGAGLPGRNVDPWSNIRTSQLTPQRVQISSEHVDVDGENKQDSCILTDLSPKIMYGL